MAARIPGTIISDLYTDFDRSQQPLSPLRGCGPLAATVRTVIKDKPNGAACNIARRYGTPFVSKYQTYGIVSTSTRIISLDVVY